MPELPDVLLYRKRIAERIKGERLLEFRVLNPFTLKSLLKPSQFDGCLLTDVTRLGKRIVLELEGEAFIVIHPMIAGRCTWQSAGSSDAPKQNKALLATWRFDSGKLSLVENSTKKRASIHAFVGLEGLQEHRREGLDAMASTAEDLGKALMSKNRTLKNALTDPHTLDGIGNAYSDEILWEARLSPAKMTSTLSFSDVERLAAAIRDTLEAWTAKLEMMYPDFPKPSQITAFRKEFAVHGKFNQPCPRCGSPVQHIVYADNETNYCARCQTDGVILADRSMSRLLKGDRPKTLDDLGR